MVKRRSILGLLIKNDINQGIIKRLLWLLSASAIVIYIALSLRYSISNLTIADIFADIYCGEFVFKKGMDFQFPVQFVTYIMIPFIITSYYPFNDFEERGKVLFTRTEKRSAWWYSKCIWNILSVIIYHAIAVLTSFLYCSVYGKVSFGLSDEMAMRTGIMPNNFKTGECIMYTIIVPTITIIAFSLLQMTISMITSPVYGHVVQITLTVLSLFFYTPVLPHNFLMIRRSVLAFEGGFKYPVVILVCSVISVISVITGKIVIEKKDIF